MLLAVLVGGLIGAERESRDKAAGFRTMTLICLGSTLFTILSIRIGGDANAARIAAQIVSGVGFLGAGVIMRDGGRVTGLTTAATVWLTASLGVGLGGGYVVLVLVATAITGAVLVLFPFVEHQIDRRRECIEYTVTCATASALDTLRGDIQTSSLRLTHTAIARDGSRLTAIWSLVGSHDAHERLTAQWLADPTITSMSC